MELEPFIADFAAYLDRMLPAVPTGMGCVYFEWDVSIGGGRFTPNGRLYAYAAREPKDLGAWDWVGETRMFEPEHDDDWDPLSFVVRLGTRDERVISEAMSAILERGASRSAALAAFLAAGGRFLWAEHDTPPTEATPA